MEWGRRRWAEPTGLPHEPLLPPFPAPALDIGVRPVANAHHGSQITQAGRGLEEPTTFSILFEGDFLKIGVPAGEEGALPIPSPAL